MKIIFIVFSIIISFLYSCGGSDLTKVNDLSKELKDRIKMKEDSLANTPNQDPANYTIDRNELVTLLEKYSKQFPEDYYAPECLDKIHMVYSGMGLYKKASVYADIILKKYPKYKKRPMILESQASNYDIFILPRDTSKVRYYNELLLKENPKMSKESKEGIEMKLKHLDLNFEEYLDFIVKKADGK